MLHLFIFLTYILQTLSKDNNGHVAIKTDHFSRYHIFMSDLFVTICAGDILSYNIMIILDVSSLENIKGPFNNTISSMTGRVFVYKNPPYALNVNNNDWLNNLYKQEIPFIHADINLTGKEIIIKNGVSNFTLSKNILFDDLFSASNEFTKYINFDFTLNFTSSLKYYKSSPYHIVMSHVPFNYNSNIIRFKEPMVKCKYNYLYFIDKMIGIGSVPINIDERDKIGTATANINESKEKVENIDYIVRKDNIYVTNEPLNMVSVPMILIEDDTVYDQVYEEKHNNDMEMAINASMNG